MSTSRKQAPVASDSGTAVASRAEHVLLPNGTPIVVRALADKTLRLARTPDDSVRRSFVFTVRAGSFYLTLYGKPGIGVPLQVFVPQLGRMQKVTDTFVLRASSAHPEADVEPILKEALSAWGQRHAFRDIVRIIRFGEEAELESLLEFTRSLAHSSWEFGVPNPWSMGHETNPAQPSHPAQPQPSLGTYRTQRGFVSLARSVQDQATALKSNFSALSQAAGQVEGLDDSARRLVLNVLREVERDLTAMNKSAGELRPALQHLPARNAPEEHATYDRLGSSTPPQGEYREIVASSSGDLFGLGYGTVDELRSLRDPTLSPTSLSASSSFADNGLTPAHNGRVVGPAETPEWDAHTEAASSPPLSSLGGSFDNIAQLLAKQHLDRLGQETEPSPSSSRPETPVHEASSPPAGMLSPAPSTLPAPSLSKAVDHTTTGLPPWLRTPPQKSLMSGPREKVEPNQVQLDHRAKRSTFIAKYAPTGARRPKARLAPVADAPAAVVNARLETSGLPRPILQLRGVAAGHRARLNPVHRKAMVIDGAALEVADLTFARSNASESRVITGRTEVSAALDEMARSQNAATLVPVPAQPASSIQPLVSSSIANTATSSGDVPRLTRAQSSKRKREVEAENAVAEEATPGEPLETLDVKKPRARVVAFAEPSTSGKAARQDTATSADDMAAMEKFCRQSASATVAFKGKPSSSKPKPRSGFLRR